MDNKQIIGQRLRALRINQDISQENMAFQLGISQSAYSRMESGKVLPDMERLQKCAELLGISFQKMVNFFYGNAPLHELLKELDQAQNQPIPNSLTAVPQSGSGRIVSLWGSAMVS